MKTSGTNGCALALWRIRRNRHWWLKKHLGGQRHDDDDSLKTAVLQWLSSQAANFYDDGIQKLVVRYESALILVAIIWKSR